MTIRFGQYVAICALFFSVALQAAEAPDKAAFDSIIREHDEAAEKASGKYAAAKTDAEREEAAKYFPNNDDYAKRLLNLARKDPKSETAFEALEWIIQRAGYSENAKPALELIAEHHLESEKMSGVAQALIYSQQDVGEKLLRQLREKSPHKKVRLTASYALAAKLANHNRSGKVPEEAIRLFKEVAESGENDSDPDHHLHLADSAKGYLFEIENLAIGKAAPEIEGEDVDGKKFKLSDYRGKVVVLDFWGDW